MDGFICYRNVTRNQDSITTTFSFLWITVAQIATSMEILLSTIDVEILYRACFFIIILNQKNVLLFWPLKSSKWNAYLRCPYCSFGREWDTHKKWSQSKEADFHNNPGKVPQRRKDWHQPWSQHPELSTWQYCSNCIAHTHTSVSKLVCGDATMWIQKVTAIHILRDSFSHLHDAKCWNQRAAITFSSFNDFWIYAPSLFAVRRKVDNSEITQLCHLFCFSFNFRDLPQVSFHRGRFNAPRSYLLTTLHPYTIMRYVVPVSGKFKLRGSFYWADHRVLRGIWEGFFLVRYFGQDVEGAVNKSHTSDFSQ